MSDQLRASSRSPSKNAVTRDYSDEQINGMSIGDLKQYCTDNKIDMIGVDQRKKDSIIDRILGKTSYSEEASATASSARARSPPRARSSPRARSPPRARSSPRASSPKASSPKASSSPRARSATPVVSFTRVLDAKLSPSKGRSASASAAADRDDPDTRALKRARESEVAAWDDWKKENGGQPWLNLVTLQHIFNRKMMPEHMIPLSEGMLRTLVILVGPAASGKSSALEKVGLGLTDNNTVRVDPDKIYEWFAHKYGYFPPEIKEITDPKPYKGESPEKYKERCANNLVKLTKQNAERLAWWLANQGTFHERYGRGFEDDVSRGFEASKFCTPKTTGVLGQYKVVLPSMANMIFEGARGRNVLLDTTGGMEEGFLEGMADRFTTAGYKVVVVLVVSSVEDCIARVSGPDGRNAQQHRKLDEEIVGRIWRDFIKAETACRWERFSRERNTDFAIVENTWTPSKKSGKARVVYKRNRDGSIKEAVPELKRILETYKVSIKPSGEFECIGGGETAAGFAKGRRDGGSSRKRRISRRRIHCSRARKTIKKYSRPLTRRRRRI